MTDPKIKALFGLKYNPFLPSIPAEDLWCPPGGKMFLFRIETLVMDGGFALISGEPGMGKSKLLHLLATHLEQIEGVVVGIIQRPQNTLGDFYRELGALFGVALKPSNRYGGFKALRPSGANMSKAPYSSPSYSSTRARKSTTSALTSCVSSQALTSIPNASSPPCCAAIPDSQNASLPATSCHWPVASGLA